MISEISQGDYRINISNETIYIQHVSYNKIVAIEKYNCNIYETDITDVKNVKVNQAFKPHAILGILKIGNIDFLVFVKICQSVGTIEGAEIFKIREAELIPIAEDSFINNFSSDVKSTIAGIKQIYSLGFFYSFHYDLTNTRQRIKKLQFTSNIIDSCEKNYFWNYNMYKIFFDKKIDSVFMVVCICGFVGITNQTIFGNNILFALISRRSVKFAGTRYNTRGIDDEGNVANFVETEQIFKFQNKFLSFVQIRGSAPIFFQQIGMTAQTQITRTPEMTTNAYTKHIESIQQNYPLIYLINLMSNGKPNESIITENIENQIKITKFNTVKYHYFDFHSECKYDNYEKIEYIIDQYIVQVLNIFKYYCEDMNTGEIYKEQTGIIRTNCLDCLDRTNIIQTRIAWKMFENQLGVMNVNTEPIFGVRFINTPKEAKIHPLMQKFKDLWAENGDYISIQYAGTASTSTSVTKNGKQGFLGYFQHGLVSITRFYQGSFEDNFKQKCIDITLQNYNTETINYNPIVNEELYKHSDKYMQNDQISVFVGTWNVAASNFNGSKLLDWLCPMKDHKPYDIYLIGLQEIVSLNATNILLVSNNSKVDFWRNIISNTLDSLDSYILIKTLDLVGLVMFVFIKENLKDNLKNIDTLVTKTGAMGTLGNKGNLSIRFNYWDTSFVAVNCHLCAHVEKNEQRINELLDILKINLKDQNKRDSKFKDHDIQFIFGDLNFRIDLDNNTCRQWIASGNLKTLTGYDQLKKSTNPNLLELHEGPLEFDPTFKYDIGTNNYDTSKKKRAPAWCDRILFKKNDNIELVKYNTVNYTNSDHKPVYAIFNVRVRKIIHEEKEKIIRDIHENNVYKRTRDLSAEIKDNFFEIKTKNVNLVDLGSPIRKDEERMLESPEKKDFFLSNDVENNNKSKKGGIFAFMNFMK